MIGANSLVNVDLPDNSIAVGSPCKVIGKVKSNQNGEVDYEHFGP
jgi:acetyltransferase-like isoleucine patch superfamily enzyme